MEGSTEERDAGDPAYGITRHFTGVSVEDARARIIEALQQEGFGILTEIDVQATFKKKLGKDVRPYVILGACKPSLADRALEQEPGAGLLLPCNVTVRQDDRGETVVSIARPLSMFQVVGRPDVEPIAREAEESLERALHRMKS